MRRPSLIKIQSSGSQQMQGRTHPDKQKETFDTSQAAQEDVVGQIEADHCRHICRQQSTCRLHIAPPTKQTMLIIDGNGWKGDYDQQFLDHGPS